MTEEWRDIPGYEGRYQASSEGRVRGPRSPGGRKLRVRQDGYVDVSLHRNGQTSYKLVHKLVAAVFLPNPAGLPEVNHKDFDRSKNRATNLEWSDRVGNVAHAKAAGRCGGRSKAVRALNADGSASVWPSQIEAEIELRGAITGIVSWALRTGRPALGRVWNRL